jgi:hypothetical protein
MRIMLSRERSKTMNILRYGMYEFLKGARYLYNRFGEKGAASGRNPFEMRRVTDEIGNEYLCPVRDLKDLNFVREEEKTKCYDYTTISMTKID